MHEKWLFIPWDLPMCMYNMLVIIFWKWNGVWSQVQCPHVGMNILFYVGQLSKMKLAKDQHLKSISLLPCTLRLQQTEWD